MTKKNQTILIVGIVLIVLGIAYIFGSQYLKSKKVDSIDAPITLEQKPEFTTELNKTVSENKETPSIKNIEKPYYMKIKLTVTDNDKQEISYVDFYRKDNKLKLVYKNDDKNSIMSQWPFPWTVLKEIYEVGDKMYSCVDFEGKIECIHDEGIGAMEIFDFEWLISLAKWFAKQEEKTVNGEKVICYSNPNLTITNTTCVYKDKDIIQLSENKNKNYGIKIETMEYELKVDDNVFKFDYPITSTQDFFNKHSDYLIPLMEKEEKIKNGEVQTVNNVNVPVSETTTNTTVKNGETIEKVEK